MKCNDKKNLSKMTSEAGIARYVKGFFYKFFNNLNKLIFYNENYESNLRGFLQLSGQIINQFGRATSQNDRF